MVTIDLGFPGGRYHATPGGHHVNEGQVEWPPSPWRLVRALLATGFTKLRWREVPPAAEELLQTLCGTLPRYVLPLATVAHSRHYMPLTVFKDRREDTSLVFDAWADVGSGRLTVSWDVTLDESQVDVLNVLVDHLTYLGRSESWVEPTVRLGPLAGEISEAQVNAWPSDRVPAGPEYEQVVLTAPVPAGDFARWLEDERARVQERLDGSRGRAVERALDAYPSSLLDALQWDTAKWRAHGWADPPGTRKVVYWRRRDALQIGRPTIAARPEAKRVECMLLALGTAKRNRSALPTVARTLPQAELLHEALVSRAGRGEAVDCPELTGRDEAGQPLRGHAHVRVLPVDLDGDQHLDHVLLVASMGLGQAAQRAVRHLRVTWQKRGQELQVAVAGGGALDELRQLPTTLLQGVERVLGPLGGARVWESVTPYVAPRHVKRSGKNTLVGQIQTELERLGFPAPITIDVLPWHGPARSLRHSVVRRKAGKPQPRAPWSVPLRLEFSEPVLGPICIGYGSHFGLGRLETAPEDRSS